ncbi:dTDP-4-dehydrorhamnose reductase [Kordiimonas marina]|uniref:dTDP-4-dehydrorhamnose reductase n=1 Tax=Kordiimonas marina TaxID=2872312 RepID=UPI001FF50355|nr:dTDP-4-dehydrorhamnose reductase [Kordiimonas marina]MCJ9429767.1 dTDP-4-dehydrorhamnose reductase [Kordiimonas marina]
MKRIFVAGKSGQVALALQELDGKHNMAVQCFGRPDFDLTDADGVKAAVQAFAPDAVINAAAYTAVDQAESDEVTALAVNAQGAANLAAAAHAVDVPFLHISTDYVFDGTKDTPYLETDATGPTGAYGRSKLAGEQAVMASNPDAMIFRTAWVYSATGKNFVKTMLMLAEKRDELGVVADQAGNPTYAPDIAEALIGVVRHIFAEGWQPSYAGVYHLAGTGDTTWYDFALATFAEGAKHGHPVPTVAALTTAEYPTPAKRPANSRLDCGKLEKTFGIQLPKWQDSLKRCVDRLFADGSFSPAQ